MIIVMQHQEYKEVTSDDQAKWKKPLRCFNRGEVGYCASNYPGKKVQLLIFQRVTFFFASIIAFHHKYIKFTPWMHAKNGMGALAIPQSLAHNSQRESRSSIVAHTYSPPCI